jgi:DNA-binding HxlR family transcriptional regulator
MATTGEVLVALHSLPKTSQIPPLGTDLSVADRAPQARRAIDLIDGRWTLAVLAELRDGGRRYQELDEALDGVSHKVLTDTLRRAERDGLVVRHLDRGRVETANLYQLTALGRSLDEPLAALERWVDAGWPKIEEARGRWNQRSN